jgi:hypothetical protein
MGDGLQNVWNLWWINEALTVLHTSPWFTPYLYHPDGVNLIGHTLNPFNGFVGIALLRVLSLVQAHNALVVFAFVMGGVACFWLCYSVCRVYWAAMIGGAVFTFSQYHFAHADGHMQLISVEWLPVFALLWIALLRRPSLKLALGAAAALLLVILCDYYYFVYSVAFAVLIATWEAVRRRDPVFWVRRSFAPSMLIFLLFSASTSGLQMAALFSLDASDPLLGSHTPDQFSTDLLGAVIPGGHWRFADLTQAFWDVLPGNIQESSVDVGVSIVLLLAFLIFRRAQPLVRQTGPWWLVLVVFWVLSLGPTLRIWGAPHPGVRMPYRELERLVPELAISGVPARMMVMVTLAAGVLVSVAFALLLRGSRPVRVIAGAVLVLMTLEYLPRPIPTVLPVVPDYVSALQRRPDTAGVLDLVSGYYSDRPFGSNTGAGIALYYQVIHQHPMTSGYIARVPTSAWQRLQAIKRSVDAGAFGLLCRDYGLRYLVIAPDAVSVTLAGAQLLDSGPDAELFDLAPGGACLT